MSAWIYANLPTVVVSLVMALVVVCAVAVMVRDRRRNKGSCPSCGGCPSCGACPSCQRPGPAEKTRSVRGES